MGGLGVGGMVAQVAALDFPDVFTALTLVGTRAVAPGPVDDDLPDHDANVMAALFSRPSPDWADRTAVLAHAAESAPLLHNDPDQAGRLAGRIWDRTPSKAPAVHMANQRGTVFARLDCAPRWREHLGEIRMPTLVVHGRLDPFFPVGNGRALAAEIPGARLLILDDTWVPDCPSRRAARSLPRCSISEPRPAVGQPTRRTSQSTSGLV